MKITIGHVLIVGVLVAVALRLSGVVAPSWFQQKTSSVSTEMTSLVGLFHSGEEPVTLSPTPAFPSPDEPPVTAPAAAVSASTAAMSTPAVVEKKEPAAVVVPAAAPSPKPVVEKPVISKRDWKKRHRKAHAAPVVTPPVANAVPPAAAPAKKEVSVKAAAVAPPATAALPANRRTADPDRKLMGKFVTMNLVSGRAVKGILEGKSATHYKIEMPGMGTLEYPVSDVKSIKSAE